MMIGCHEWQVLLKGGAGDQSVERVGMIKFQSPTLNHNLFRHGDPCYLRRLQPPANECFGLKWWKVMASPGRNEARSTHGCRPESIEIAAVFGSKDRAHDIANNCGVSSKLAEYSLGNRSIDADELSNRKS